jgi:hypothetical protein
VERCAKIGLIDNVTRKPVPHPDWFVKKYSYLYGSESPPELLRQTIPDPPKNCFQWRTIVRFSDMDSNFHVPYSPSSCKHMMHKNKTVFIRNWNHIGSVMVNVLVVR